MEAERFYHSHWCKYLSEFVGTYFLVLTVGCNVLTGSPGAALSIGIILMVMIYALGSVSGAHFNPAVTMSILCSARGLISFQDAIFYVVFQLVGAICAGATYCALFGYTFMLQPVGKHTMASAIIVEIAYSTALCYVVLNVATTHKQDGNNYFGLAIGFTVVAAVLAIGGISGCSLNPAVSFGTMMINTVEMGSKSLQYFGLYFFSPLLGSLLATFFFYLVQRADEYRKDY
jgi:aquaporin Z